MARWALLVAPVLLLSLAGAAACWAQPLHPTVPQWRQRHAAARQEPQPGRQVEILSAGFLGLPYVDSPLIGSDSQKEVLVNDLSRIDCFTLLDFVEALRRSTDLAEFDRQLLAVRYRGGQLSYQDRHHFFSDWGLANNSHLQDMTLEIAGDRAATLPKSINRKNDGTLWLPGLPVRAIQLRYLPTTALDEATLSHLQTGDYVGIVTLQPGLDVSHTGILIWQAGTLYLRHASSRAETRRVLDEPLLPYLQGKPGLLLFRPNNPALSIPHHHRSNPAQAISSGKINRCIEMGKCLCLRAAYRRSCVLCHLGFLFVAGSDRKNFRGEKNEEKPFRPAFNNPRPELFGTGSGHNCPGRGTVKFLQTSLLDAASGKRGIAPAHPPPLPTKLIDWGGGKWC